MRRTKRKSNSSLDWWRWAEYDTYTQFKFWFSTYVRILVLILIVRLRWLYAAGEWEWEVEDEEIRGAEQEHRDDTLNLRLSDDVWFGIVWCI